MTSHEDLYEYSTEDAADIRWQSQLGLLEVPYLISQQAYRAADIHSFGHGEFHKVEYASVLSSSQR
jgi:hypothetical protein